MKYKDVRAFNIQWWIDLVVAVFEQRFLFQLLISELKMNLSRNIRGLPPLSLLMSELLWRWITQLAREADIDKRGGCSMLTVCCSLFNQHVVSIYINRSAHCWCELPMLGWFLSQYSHSCIIFKSKYVISKVQIWLWCWVLLNATIWQ